MSASSKKKLRKEQNAAALTEKQLAEQKESKKLKVYTISFVSVLALVIVIALAVGGINAFMNSGILQRSNDAVTIGENTLSNADLNYYYMDLVRGDFNSWYQSYGENTQMFVQWMQGLDITKPLNEQVADPDTGKTFADTYKDKAIESAKEVYAIYDLAQKAGFTLTEEQKQQVEINMQSLELYAAMNNSSTSSYLKQLYGPGATLDNYRNYLEVKNVATNYAQSIYDGFEYSKTDISDRNKEDYDEFSTFDYSVFFVDADSFLACNDEAPVEGHEHSAEEQANALKAAEEAAKALVASGATTTEELNAAIAASDAYKDDEDAKAGDRMGYSLSQVSENQGNWLKAADRKVGDLDMLPNEVKTTDADGKETTKVTGYHVMLYLGREDNEQNLVTVRHILANFKGGTTDANGNKTYNLSEKNAAKEAIEAIQKEWQDKGGTLEAFEALAKEKTEDGGSKENGGLYEDVYPGQMVTNFNDWCFAEGRKAGDYGIVETEYGYHLIYFVSKNADTTYRDLLIEDTLRSEEYTEWYETQLENAKVTELNTKYLSLDHIMAMN